MNLVFGEAELTEFLAGHPGVQAFHFIGKGTNAKKVLDAATNTMKRFSFSLDGKAGAMILDESWLIRKNHFLASILEGRARLPWSTTRVFILENNFQQLKEELACAEIKNSGIKITMDLDMCSEKQQDPLEVPEVLVNVVKYPADMVKWLNIGYLGLSNSIWCADQEKFERLAVKLNCGKVYFNDWMPYSELPWGARQSAYGEDPRSPSTFCQRLDFESKTRRSKLVHDY